MKQTRRNHYVPQFYLRYFVGDGERIWVYQKDLLTPRPQSPINTAVEKDLYSLADQHGKQTDLIERDLMTPLEQTAAPILDRLQRPGTSPSSTEREQLAYFLAVFHSRVPRNIALVAAMGSAVAVEHMTAVAEDPTKFHDIYEGFKAHEGSRNLPDEEAMRRALLDLQKHVTIRMSRTEALAWSMTFVERLFPVLLNLHWSLCDAPSHQDFITCDSPVVSFVPPSGYRAQFGGNFVSPRLEITFPISPTACLLLARKQRQNRWRCSARFLSEVNRRTATMAHKYVFSRVNSQRIARLVRGSAVATESWIDREYVRAVIRRKVHLEYGSD